MAFCGVQKSSQANRSKWFKDDLEETVGLWLIGTLKYILSFAFKYFSLWVYDSFSIKQNETQMLWFV